MSDQQQPQQHHGKRAIAHANGEEQQPKSKRGRPPKAPRVESDSSSGDKPKAPKAKKPLGVDYRVGLARVAEDNGVRVSGAALIAVNDLVGLVVEQLAKDAGAACAAPGVGGKTARHKQRVMKAKHVAAAAVGLVPGKLGPVVAAEVGQALANYRLSAAELARQRQNRAEAAAAAE